MGGNVLIISEDCNTLQPNDRAGGGTIIFTFDTPTTVYSMGLLDEQKSTQITLTNVHDVERAIYSDPVGNNGFTSVEIDLEEVVQIQVNRKGSGGISYLIVEDKRCVSDNDDASFLKQKEPNDDDDYYDYITDIHAHDDDYERFGFSTDDDHND